MTKILVFSDSHGKTTAMDEIIQSTDHDYLIHCGDYGLDLKGSNVYHVKGNCDPWAPAPQEVQIEVEGHSILVVHGHKHQVKSGLLNLAYYAMQKQADIVIFGHTHHPLIAWEGELLLLNPGSISLPPPGVKPSYIELTLDSDTVTPIIHYLNQE